MHTLFESLSKTKKWIVAAASALIVCSLCINLFIIYRLVSSDNQIQEEQNPALARLEELNASMDNYLYQDLIPLMGEYVTSNGYMTDTWSFAVIDAETGKMASWNSHPMCSASIIKQFIMGAVFDNYDKIIQEYDESQVQAWLRGMITRSDNDCANALIAVCGFGDNDRGIEAINAFCQKYGYSQTRLDHPFYAGSADDKDNLSSAIDNAAYQYDILTGRFEHSEEMLNLLKGQQFTHKIPAGLPGYVRTANKTGDLDTVENDCAIVFANNGTYILGIMTEGLANSHSAQRVIRGLSYVVYKYFQELDREAMNKNDSGSVEEVLDEEVQSDAAIDEKTPAQADAAES